MKLRNYILAIAACLALCSASACGRNENPPAETKQEAGNKDTVMESGTEEAEGKASIEELEGTPSDYSKEENWMRIPEITHEVDGV